MKRRDFITLLGGAAAAWPLAARAQRNERVRRIGVFFAGAVDANDTDTRSRLAAFQQGLQQLGWSDGRNVQIDYRFGGGNAALIRKYAGELVALSPEVLFSSGAATVAPLLQVTRTVPIIFAGVVDPVGAGFVDALARPGGNATGFILFEYSLGGTPAQVHHAARRRCGGVAVGGAGAAAGDAGDRFPRNRVTKFWDTDISSISTGPR